MAKFQLATFQDGAAVRQANVNWDESRQLIPRILSASGYSTYDQLAEAITRRTGVDVSGQTLSSLAEAGYPTAEQYAALFVFSQRDLIDNLEGAYVSACMCSCGKSCDVYACFPGCGAGVLSNQEDAAFGKKVTYPFWYGTLTCAPVTLALSAMCLVIGLACLPLDAVGASRWLSAPFGSPSITLIGIACVSALVYIAFSLKAHDALRRAVAAGINVMLAATAVLGGICLLSLI